MLAWGKRFTHRSINPAIYPTPLVFLTCYALPRFFSPINIETVKGKDKGMQISQLSTIVHSIMGTGTEHAKRETISPQNLLEYILDIFTLGRWSHNRGERYEEIVNALAAQLNEHLPYDPPNPPKWDIEGCLSIRLMDYNVTFIASRGGDEVHIEIGASNDSKFLYSHVNRERFSRVCTLLLLRDRYPVKDIPIAFTENGCIDLQNANLRFLDLRGIDLQGACLDNAHLGNANLSGANLHQASLKAADLNYTKLYGANLNGADLSAARRNYMP